MKWLRDLWHFFGGVLLVLCMLSFLSFNWIPGLVTGFTLLVMMETEESLFEGGPNG